MASFGLRRALGVAVGKNTVDATAVGARAPVWSRPIEPLADGAASWPALAEALRELRQARLPGGGGALVIALLPPLVELRPIVLPPLGGDEARQVLTRNPARYFLGAREPQVISAAAFSGPKGSRCPIVAAAAPARAVEAIHGAARDAGWTIRAIVPAEEAWRAAALAVWPDLRRGSHDLVVLRSGHTEVLHLDDGMLTGIRRFGEVSAGPSSLREALTPAVTDSRAGGLAVFGTGARRAALGQALRAAAARLMAPSPRWASLTESPEAAAAAFASAGRALELVPESIWRLRRRRYSRVTVAATAAAAALVVAAAGLELWGVRRELAQVRHDRALLRPKVAALVATRDSAALFAQGLSDLAAAVETTTPWSDLLTAVTAALPRDAHLTAFRAEGDSLVLEGVAAHAAAVFTAIEAVPGLVQVRSAAPVRRELGDREATDQPERFAVGARVVPTGDTLRLALGAAVGQR